MASVIALAGANGLCGGSVDAREVSDAGRAFAEQQATDQQNQQILDELRQIRQLLERLVNQQPPVPRAPVDEKVKLPSVAGHALGKPDAPLTMVEFTDLQCPFCRQFHVTTFEQLKKDYIDTGKLRYISRDFPLDQLHPFATRAARATRCAAGEGKFWEMRHALLASNTQLSEEAIAAFAQGLKLDATRFKACFEDASRFAAEMQKDWTEAMNAGVSGTPTFIIGRTSVDGIDGIRVVGAQPYASFDAKLKELLAPKLAPPGMR